MLKSFWAVSKKVCKTTVICQDPVNLPQMYSQDVQIEFFQQNITFHPSQYKSVQKPQKNNNNKKPIGITFCWPYDPQPKSRSLKVVSNRTGKQSRYKTFCIKYLCVMSNVKVYARQPPAGQPDKQDWLQLGHELLSWTLLCVTLTLQLFLSYIPCHLSNLLYCFLTHRIASIPF